MGISKTEINLRRLLVAAPHQQNHAKLLHYVTTLREQLEELTEEKISDGLPRISKAQVNDYSEKIEAIASKLAVPVSTMQEFEKPSDITTVGESPSKNKGESPILTSLKLMRRRFVPHNHADTNNSAPVKLDAAAQTHIQKHRKLQEDLTDEMVGLAQQLKGTWGSCCAASCCTACCAPAGALCLHRSGDRRRSTRRARRVLCVRQKSARSNIDKCLPRSNSKRVVSS